MRCPTHLDGNAGRHLDHEPAAMPNRTNRRRLWLLGGFAAIALLLLALEHRTHLLAWLPWIFLLACPLMHLLMHGGHGHHHRGHAATKNERLRADGISSEREKNND